MFQRPPSYKTNWDQVTEHTCSQGDSLARAHSKRQQDVSKRGIASRTRLYSTVQAFAVCPSAEAMLPFLCTKWPVRHLRFYWYLDQTFQAFGVLA